MVYWRRLVRLQHCPARASNLAAYPILADMAPPERLRGTGEGGWRPWTIAGVFRGGRWHVGVVDQYEVRPGGKLAPASSPCRRCWRRPGAASSIQDGTSCAAPSCYGPDDGSQPITATGGGRAHPIWMRTGGQLPSIFMGVLVVGRRLHQAIIPGNATYLRPCQHTCDIFVVD